MDNKTVEQKVDYLLSVSLFEDLRKVPETVTDLAAGLEPKSYTPGQAIFKEGENGTELFLLIQGKAAVFKTTPDGELYKVVILTAENHAFFGEGGLLDTDARSASILAETDCTCLMLRRETFEEFSKRHPEAALLVLGRISKTVMARLRKTNHDLMLLYRALVAEIRGH